MLKDWKMTRKKYPESKIKEIGDQARGDQDPCKWATGAIKTEKPFQVVVK